MRDSKCIIIQYTAFVVSGCVGYEYAYVVAMQTLGGGVKTLELSIPRGMKLWVSSFIQKTFLLRAR